MLLDLVPTLQQVNDWYGIIYGYYQPASCRWYIGQTTQNLEEYCYTHYIWGKGLGRPAFSNAINFYGIDSFKRVVLGFARSKEELDEMECYYIKFYNSIKNGYNCKDGGSHGKHSEETKKLISENVKKGQAEMSLEAKILQSQRKSLAQTGDKNPQWQKPQSPEVNKRRSEALTGEKNHAFGKPGQFLGKTHSEKTKKKMSESALAKTPEQKANMSKIIAQSNKNRSIKKKFITQQTNELFSIIFYQILKYNTPAVGLN